MLGDPPSHELVANLTRFVQRDGHEVVDLLTNPAELFECCLVRDALVATAEAGGIDLGIVLGELGEHEGTAVKSVNDLGDRHDATLHVSRLAHADTTVSALATRVARISIAEEIITAWLSTLSIGTESWDNPE